MQEHEALRNERYLHERIFIGRDRLHLLVEKRFRGELTRREILRLTPAQLAYKLIHGSQAAIPEWLAPDNRRK